MGHLFIKSVPRYQELLQLLYEIYQQGLTSKELSDKIKAILKQTEYYNL